MVHVMIPGRCATCDGRLDARTGAYGEPCPAHRGALERLAWDSAGTVGTRSRRSNCASYTGRGPARFALS